MPDTDPREDAMRRVGRRIAELRRLHDLTQTAFAEACYVAQPAVSKWERGRSMPRAAAQFRVADVLKVSRSQLFREVIEYDEAVA
jgi:transcriptional regulator with XRE-family HTH domain